MLRREIGNISALTIHASEFPPHDQNHEYIMMAATAAFPPATDDGDSPSGCSSGFAMAM